MPFFTPKLNWPIRLLICGDREWKDSLLIKTVLDEIGPKRIALIIEGDCRGADKMAGRLADLLDIEYVAEPADWTQHGNAAGLC